LSNHKLYKCDMTLY